MRRLTFLALFRSTWVLILCALISESRSEESFTKSSESDFSATIFNPARTVNPKSDKDHFDSESTTKITPSNLKVKRWDAASALPGMTWTEYRIVDQGVRWQDWQPASCVQRNEHGSIPVTMGMTRMAAHRGNWKTGFNPDFGMRSALESGHVIAKATSLKEQSWYTVPRYGYGQVWSQQSVVWQDQQRRQCTKHYYGTGGIICGPWGECMRGELPVVDGVNFVWNTDWRKLDFNTCGGGT